MRRRTFIKSMAGAGAGLLLGSTVRPVRAADANACFVPWDSDTQMMSWPKKAPPYRIALSNSYIGNAWRSEMVTIAKLYSERDSVKPLLKEFRIASSGNNVSAQIAQINQMVLSGVDAIITDAASPTGLNSTINRAIDAGVLVVSFDNVVTAKKAMTLNQDQYEMGKSLAEFIVKHMGDSGHVLMVRGVAGTQVDIDRYNGGMSVFGEHAGIETTEVYGKWDSGTAQKVTADALAAAGDSFDAVWAEGGDDGIIRAFEHAGADIPPIAGEAENGFRKYAAHHKSFPMLSIGQSAAMSAMSLEVALRMLQGHKMPRSLSVPLHKVTNTDMQDGVKLEKGENWWPDVPDSFFCGVNIPQCGLKFDPQVILNTEI